MNKVILKGFLTKDPERVDNKSGKSLCRFTIAVNRRFKKDTTDFINCIAWDKTADHILSYFNKGSEILVTGRLEVDRYDDQDGKTVYRTNINIEETYFCGKKSNAETKSDKPSGNTNKATPNTNNDDELPF
jgi:single-strand DNA-binding protein